MPTPPPAPVQPSTRAVLRDLQRLATHACSLLTQLQAPPDRALVTLILLLSAECTRDTLHPAEQHYIATLLLALTALTFCAAPAAGPATARRRRRIFAMGALRRRRPSRRPLPIPRLLPAPPASARAPPPLPRLAPAPTDRPVPAGNPRWPIAAALAIPPPFA